MAADSRRWFAAPAPIRALFKHFPLAVYPAESLPHRAPSPARARPSLYVFTADDDDDDDDDDGAPSFNPSCLKWQTFLRIAGVDVELVASNNHASPSGALPFLLTAGGKVLTGDKIRQYGEEHAPSKVPDVASFRMEAYQSLLAQSIRPAWLHALYILPSNLPLLTKLYLPPSPLLRQPIHQILHAAATAEILKTTRRATIAPSQLYTDATEALRALSTLLGDDEWFLGAEGPGLFDAEVFSYTYLMLDDGLEWPDNTLVECLDQFGNLVQHRMRLYERCWGKKTQ